MKSRSGYDKAKSWWNDFRQKNWTLVHYLRRKGPINTEIEQDAFIGHFMIRMEQEGHIKWGDEDFASHMKVLDDLYHANKVYRITGAPRGVAIAWKDRETNEIGEGWSLCHDHEPIYETAKEVQKRVDDWKRIHVREVPLSLYESRVVHSFPLDRFNRHVGLMKAVLGHHAPGDLPREVEKVLLSEDWRERKEKYFGNKTAKQ